MPVYKNKENGTWYVLTRYVDWKGNRKQKCKRGFQTKKEAQEWERVFQQQNTADMDMTFEAFVELYISDVKPRIKENTWLTKEHIITTKILPYFGSRVISEITTKDVLAWQNELLAYRGEKHQGIETLVHRCIEAWNAYHRLNTTNGKLYQENVYLRSENDRLTSDITYLTGRLKDYKLLHKILGREHMDSMLEQAKQAQRNKRNKAR